MDPNIIVLLLFGAEVVLGVIAYLLKQNIDNTKKVLERHQTTQDSLRADINDVRVNYVHKADFQQLVTRMDERFDRLDDKLDKWNDIR